jgi:hypothetical protein
MNRLLWAAPLVCLLLVPPIHQSEAYHSFADQRALLGIANFWNVASNAAFLFAAAYGLRGIKAFRETWERAAFAITVFGSAMVAFGSAYYHWSPDSTTLVWDRLPMTLVFMSIFALTLGDRIDPRLGRRSLIPLLAAGVASVLIWKNTGDLRSYVLVQFYPMLAIPVLLTRPSRYGATPGAVAMIVLYALAKVFELADHQIAAFLPTGGHPWKHVIAAAALVCYMSDAVRWRRMAPPHASFNEYTPSPLPVSS